MAKTIIEKLNLHKSKRIAVLNRPEGEHDLSELADYDTTLDNGPYDVIFAYVLNMEDLQKLVTNVIDGDHLQQGGYLYAAYPKKGNKVYPTYIHRDHLFVGLGADEEGYVGASGLKFARMVGLNEVFTVIGLKMEPKKKATTSTKLTSPKPSQRADDYISMIPTVEQDLQDLPEVLAFYRSLTPGYQKDWARYIYSAMQEETRSKRRADMKKILGGGYKSIDIYRRDNR